MSSLSRPVRPVRLFRSNGFRFVAPKRSKSSGAGLTKQQFAPLRRIEHSPKYPRAFATKALHPRTIFGTELPLKFGSQPRGQRGAFAARGDCDLQRSAAQHRRIIKIAIWRIVHSVAQHTAVPRLAENRTVKRGGRRRSDY